MRKRRYKILLATVLIVSAIYVFNASWRIPAGEPELRPIAHRGIHQTFSVDGLQKDTCTAARIHPPTHDYIENTIRSMRAAFAAGADIVELDVHPTIDGKFAVLHDWSNRIEVIGPAVKRPFKPTPLHGAA